MEAPKHDHGSEEKMGIFLDFFGGYIPKITENQPFFRRYHTKTEIGTLVTTKIWGGVGIRAP